MPCKQAENKKGDRVAGRLKLSGAFMMRRPWIIFPVGFWVLVAGFALLRPLPHGALQPALSRAQVDALLAVLFLLVIAEAICLLRLRQTAIHIAILILALWTALICARIWFARKYSPLIFGPGPEGMQAYVVPIAAILLNAAGIAALIHPKFRAMCREYRYDVEHREKDLEKRLLEKL